MSQSTSQLTSETLVETDTSLLAEPEPSATTEPLSAPPAEPRWSAGTRLAFRFGFCYFMVYALCCGNATVWEALVPVYGGYLSEWLHWPFAKASLWLVNHLFHVAGAGAKLHGGGSGDRAVDWIALGVMFLVAVAATLVWTALDRRRQAYPTLFGWFRFVLRLTLGVAMFGYGMSKVFPLQMAPPSLAVLNEPLGNTSPMTMLWTLIGLNPGYEMICGAAEVVAGVLILCRRTALFGALITAFVATNIVLYNFFFDVPVKIYAAQLLLMSIAVIIPDAHSLFRYFWQHEPTTPSATWVPPTSRLWFRRTITGVEAWIFVVVGVALPVLMGISYTQQLKSLKHPSPLTGEWHLTAATKPYLTGDGAPMTDIFFEPSGRTMVRSTDSVLWRGGAQVDDKKHTLRLGSVGHEGPAIYAMAQPTPMQLVLTPTGKNAMANGTLSLTRVPLPTHYPLLDRGFHLVNEWGLER